MSGASKSRRKFIGRTAQVSLAAVAAPYVSTSRAAGSISIGFWDHWVPGANQATTDLVNEWAAKEKVEVKIDYITSQGNKNLLTIAAEAQAKSGHDILAFPTWQPSDQARLLEPVDDVMADLIKEHGEVNATVRYLGRADDRWIAVPATSGSQAKPPCSRIDLMQKHAGIDVRALYPAGAKPNADSWNMDTFLKAATACHAGGNPFGIGFGGTSDSVDACGAFFQAFGATLVDAKGNITVKSDATRKTLDYLKQLLAVLPPDVPAWDDASNNKWLLSGNGALIMNPPSTWAVAKRDAPQIAEQLWTHGMPSGPNGRYQPFLPYFWGIWSFGKNKAASKSLLRHLSTRDAIAKMVAVSGGYDLPAYEKLTTLSTWAEAAPPAGTLFHYPNPFNHQTLSIAAAPAPPRIASQIYTQAIMTKMAVRHAKGESMDKTIGWAESELEGFMRT